LEVNKYENHISEFDMIIIKCRDCGYEETQRHRSENIPLINHLKHIIKKVMKIEMENMIKIYLNKQNFKY